MNRRVLFWTLAVGMLVLDQAVKAWARHQFYQGEAWAVWPGVFEFTLTYNRGIAFGLAQGMGVWLAPVAVAIAIAAGIYSHRHPHEATVTHVAMSLLASGSVGNLIDRLWLGKVTDMFWLRAIDFPVFNVADSCITIATVMLMLTWWREGAKSAPKPAPAEPSDAG